MAEQIAPTKSNLQKVKRWLRVAQEGFSLLDRKRKVLLRELTGLVKEAREAQAEAATSLTGAYDALRAASITLGTEEVAEIAEGCEPTSELKILAKSVMGAWIPAVVPGPAIARPAYSFHGTNAALDEAVRRFRQAADVLARSAALENAVIRLAQEIQRTQKRANALHNVLIPRYQEQKKFIVESLEEREREEFFKVKLVKRRLESR